ncbi:glycosyltransferase family 4 protein [Cyclobacterium jeungdonense]|uniref:Glycosyltransferase family 1 protein n=1 Tax=Cyclobacterium jeungdonense TaxID=708087 RepID=A0ABT8CGR2_9BACT|nr:glycosyltransferase family 1 protein [Cyclobacterium jeungdonense]MDN3690733.1 glycosyltransferase family 1 protein [Cyclobacterium jeungdonense]
MRIGIEAQRIFRKKRHGMDMVALALIRNLQEMDTENQYFIFVNETEDSSPIQPTDNFTIIPLPASPYPLWEQYHLARAVKKYELDLLHCTSNTAPVFCQTKLVITLHDIIYLEKINLKEGSWYQRLGNLYRRWNVPVVMKKAAGIFTVSAFEQERITRHFGLDSSTVAVVYNGVASHFKSETISRQQEVRETYALPKTFMLFLGNTDPKKNLKGVLKSLALLESANVAFPVLVMPDIGEEVLQSMLSEIGAPLLLSKIHLTGYIPNEDLPAIYSQAVLFLYPSLRESFGLPILEAMACGCPVITSNTSSMPEVAGNAAMLIDPFDPESIRQGIEQLLNNEEIREKLIAKGHQRPALFDYKKGAATTLAKYQDILHQA